MARPDVQFDPWEPTKIIPITKADYERWCVICAENKWTPPANIEEYIKQIDKCRKAIRGQW